MSARLVTAGLLLAIGVTSSACFAQCRSPYAPACPPFADLPRSPLPDRPSFESPGPMSIPPQAPGSAASPAAEALGDGRGAALASGTAALPGFIGDLLTFRLQPFARQFRAPAVSGGLKITENEGMRPQDRVYVSFNYFANVNADYNRALQASIGRLDFYRETFGIEKTFLDGRASAGLRLPLATLSADDRGFPGMGGVSTLVGDLGIVVKGTVYDDEARGRYISLGLVTTVPTGGGQWGDGTAYVADPRDVVLQPFVGYILRRGDWYLQGCNGFAFPTSAAHPSYAYGDWSLGWVAYRNPNPDGFLTAAIPIVETHVLAALIKSGPLSTQLGVADVVSFTEGVTWNLRRRTFLTLAVAEPVSSLRPYDIEAIVQLNVRY